MTKHPAFQKTQLPDLNPKMGVFNHWTGLLDSNYNALKTVSMLSDNIYQPVELHNTL